MRRSHHDSRAARKELCNFDVCDCKRQVEMLNNEFPLVEIGSAEDKANEK